MKEKMKEFILSKYPNAVLRSFYKTPFGEIQYSFYENPKAINERTCIMEHNKFLIVMER